MMKFENKEEQTIDLSYTATPADKIIVKYELLNRFCGFEESTSNMDSKMGHLNIG